jgi:protein gp37
MGANTAIEWTDATWNPVGGCSVTSPGCTHCYAMKLAGTRLRNHPLYAGTTSPSKAGPVFNGTMTVAADDHDVWTWPLRWRGPKEPVRGKGSRPLVFVGDMADLFHAKRPFETIDRVFAVMALAQHIDFQLLTKRADWMQEYIRMRTDSWILMLSRAINKLGLEKWADRPGRTLPRWPLPNVWLGVSAEDQRRANERIPLLLQAPAAKRFISAEPLLENVTLTRLERSDGAIVNALTGEVWIAGCGSVNSQTLYGPKLDQVITGGLSGTVDDITAMHPDWARWLLTQCQLAGTAFFFKQWGEWASAAVRIGSGEMVFRQFTTFDQWVNKASTWVNGGICLDRLGKEMKNGADMAKARDEGRFPVTIMHRVGKKAAGRKLDGRTWSEFPPLEGSI